MLYAFVTFFIYFHFCFFLFLFLFVFFFFFFSSRRRHTRSLRDWSSDVCSSDLLLLADRLHSTLLQRRFGVGFAFGIAQVRRFARQARPFAQAPDRFGAEIGRASCRERV